MNRSARSQVLQRQRETAVAVSLGRINRVSYIVKKMDHDSIASFDTSIFEAGNELSNQRPRLAGIETA